MFKRLGMFNISGLALPEICRKRALWALFLLMSSSCSGPCGQWQGQTCEGSIATFSSARMYLAPANEFSGLELELVQTVDGLRMYINVYGLEIPTEQPGSHNSRVFISFKDHSYHFSAIRFTGGQKLLVPQYVLTEIVEYLQEGQSVHLQVGRYEANIYPDKFVDVFSKMARAWPGSLPKDH